MNRTGVGGPRLGPPWGVLGRQAGRFGFGNGTRLELIAQGVDFELRETYESALAFGRETLAALGLDPERA
jgi:hypothetical protein